MPDTDRMYALTSTYTHPWWPNEAGPGMLINDAVLAMRWYLSHEREDNLAVAGHVSDDGGATWQQLPPHELLADTERALGRARHAPDEETRQTAALVHNLLAAEAAEWLDARIRFVPPEDPAPWSPETPAISSWRRGGHIWALALGTIPPDAVTTVLTAEYTDPQPEGPDKLRTAARETLMALALAETPDGAEVSDLLQAFEHLDKITFWSETGQLRGRAEDALRGLLDHMATHLPEIAAAIAAHPDPQHPVHQAARMYLLQLARRGRVPGAAQDLLGDAGAAAAQALAEAGAVPSSAQRADAPAPPTAIAGYPRLLPDLQAAARWRTVSPAARRDAEQTMEQLVQASTRLAQAAAEGEPWLDGRPRNPVEAQALDTRDYYRQHLDELNSRHAVLMHASILADAESAAEAARHAAIAAAAEATLPPADQPRTKGQAMKDHDAFMAQVSTAEEGISQTLGEQRQLTRDALHRLFPQITGSSGLHLLRAQLIDHSGLGLDAYKRAYHTIGETGRQLAALEAGYRSGHVEIGRPQVTAAQVEQARSDARKANQRFTDLRTSQPQTLRAVRVLDGVMGLSPSADHGPAARAARLTAQSRERALLPTPMAAGPRRNRTTGQAPQTHHHQQPAAAEQYTRLP
ncbi:hypothetical protein ACNPQN_32730 [Streptomyces sp. NPDC056297]|uniref:hypothetical protein n=1 Tax=unclassified Streptomyces TaxID=2593676 RepID=UPI0035D73D2F